MTNSTIDLSAGPVEYQESGPSDGTPVVLVHGFLMNRTVWGSLPDRLAAAGFRVVAPTLPIGGHRVPMRAGADLSPTGLAVLLGEFLDGLDLTRVVLVGNDTGGALCQLLLDIDDSRIDRLVLTNCDAFDTFPPAPFDLLFRLVRHPGAAGALMQPMRWAGLRTSPVGFGGLAHRRLPAAETLTWVLPYLSDSDVRRDTAAFARTWTGRELIDSGGWLAGFDRPVLVCWGMRDRFFTPDLGRRLVEIFPNAELVEVPDAGALVALDAPDRLAGAITAFATSRTAAE